MYGDEHIKTLGEHELVELGGNPRHGVPIATPVFDGAKEADIEKMLDLAGRSPGQSRCTTAARATLTGQTVGEHLHALAAPPGRRQDPCSIGPYSWSPSSRWAAGQFGGQRFGEMEVWALEAMAPPTRCRKC